MGKLLGGSFMRRTKKVEVNTPEEEAEYPVVFTEGNLTPNVESLEVEIDSSSPLRVVLEKPLVYTGEIVPSVLKAVRRHCIECSGNTPEVKLCRVSTCYIFPFRMGKNPYRPKRILSDAQKGEMAGKLNSARAARAKGE